MVQHVTPVRAVKKRCGASFGSPHPTYMQHMSVLQPIWWDEHAHAVPQQFLLLTDDCQGLAAVLVGSDSLQNPIRSSVHRELPHDRYDNTTKGG